MMMFASTSLAVCLALALLHVANAGDTKTCTLDKYGEVTPFYGDDVHIELGCNTRLAYLMCGAYKLRVNVQMEQLEGRRNSATRAKSVRLEVSYKNKLVKLELDAKDIDEDEDDVWQAWDGTKISDIQFDDKHSERDYAILRKDDIFEIRFYDDGKVTVECDDVIQTPKNSRYHTFCGNDERDEIDQEKSRAFILGDEAATQDRGSFCYDAHDALDKCRDPEDAIEECWDDFEDDLDDWDGDDDFEAETFIDCLVDECD